MFARPRRASCPPPLFRVHPLYQVPEVAGRAGQEDSACADRLVLRAKSPGVRTYNKHPTASGQGYPLGGRRRREEAMADLTHAIA